MALVSSIPSSGGSPKEDILRDHQHHQHDRAAYVNYVTDIFQLWLNHNLPREPIGLIYMFLDTCNWWRITVCDDIGMVISLSHMIPIIDRHQR
jgi:hypothetical protein